MFSVNVAHSPAEGLQGEASMSQSSQNPAWSPRKAVDGNTDQVLLTTCAILDYTKNYKSVWWKVRLGKRFNVAFLEVYFRSDSMSYFYFSLFSIAYTMQRQLADGQYFALFLKFKIINTETLLDYTC